MLKGIKRNIFKYLASDDGYALGHKISSTFKYIGNTIEFERSKREETLRILKDPDAYKIDQTAIDRITEKMIVKHGPFKGMKYPELKTLGGKYIVGPIISKILGCYEQELHELLDYCNTKDYSEIIDIGSAEGYYSIGLALKYPNARHIAFDIDENATTMCKKIAVLNGVSERVEVRSFCDGSTLSNFKFRTRALILCDCEGFEKELFSTTDIKNLLHCDILIELHDFADVTIYPTLHKLFKDTHQERIIGSLSNAQKIREYDYPEIKELNAVTINKIISEHRPQQEWLFLEARS